MVDAAALCKKGPVRKTNQDACCVVVAQTSSGALSMAAVCDGVGGLSQGEVASGWVVNRLASWFTNDVSALMANEEPASFLERLDLAWDACLQDLHDELRAYGSAHDLLMGTTLTGVIATGGRYLACQVGDSRLYLLEEAGISQVTEDQTLVGKLLSEGAIGEQEANTYPGKNVILQAVGVGEELHPHFTRGTYAPDDLFLLCTDGVHGWVDNRTLRACLTQGDAQAQNLETTCATVAAHAFEAGTQDNVSVVCLRGDPLAHTTHNTLVVGDGAW